MRMLSASAAQNVTFDCVNSVVWFDKAGSTYRKAMKLMGSNEMEFTATSPEHERPTAHEDGCEVRMSPPSPIQVAIEAPVHSPL